MRFVLRVIAANPVAPFVPLIYSLSNLFLWPFYGMMGDPVTPNGMVLEVTTLVAMMVYALLLATTLWWAVLASSHALPDTEVADVPLQIEAPSDGLVIAGDLIETVDLVVRS